MRLSRVSCIRHLFDGFGSACRTTPHAHNGVISGTAFLPQWLEILPEDDEKTKTKKKKLQKAHKSKMRFAKLDKETKERQSSWQNFQKGKVAKKKPAGKFCV